MGGLKTTFNEEALAALPATAPFVQAIRKQAFEEFLALPVPSQETEEWRYTDLSDLDLDLRPFAEGGGTHAVNRPRPPPPPPRPSAVRGGGGAPRRSTVTGSSQRPARVSEPDYRSSATRRSYPPSSSRASPTRGSGSATWTRRRWSVLTSSSPTCTPSF